MLLNNPQIKHVSLEDAMNDWRNSVGIMYPALRGEYVRTVCEEIVRRADRIARSSSLSFPELAGYFLTRTREWVKQGLPVQKIGAKLPKDLEGVGMLLIEQGLDGKPLSAEELKHAMAAKIWHKA